MKQKKNLLRNYPKNCLKKKIKSHKKRKENKLKQTKNN